MSFWMRLYKTIYHFVSMYPIFKRWLVDTNNIYILNNEISHWLEDGSRIFLFAHHISLNRTREILKAHIILDGNHCRLDQNILQTEQIAISSCHNRRCSYIWLILSVTHGTHPLKICNLNHHERPYLDHVICQRFVKCPWLNYLKHKVLQWIHSLFITSSYKTLKFLKGYVISTPWYTDFKWFLSEKNVRFIHWADTEK